MWLGWVGIRNLRLYNYLNYGVVRKSGKIEFTNYYSLLINTSNIWFLFLILEFSHYSSLQGGWVYEKLKFGITIITGWVGFQKRLNLALRN